MANELDLQRLRELIGREPTICPEDIAGFIKFLSDFAQSIGKNAANAYHFIELAALPKDEREKLSPDEYTAALHTRQIARKAGFWPLD